MALSLYVISWMVIVFLALACKLRLRFSRCLLWNPTNVLWPRRSCPGSPVCILRSHRQSRHWASPTHHPGLQATKPEFKTFNHYYRGSLFLRRFSPFLLQLKPAGIIIFRGGSMFVDFLGYPDSPRTYNTVMNLLIS